MNINFCANINYKQIFRPLKIVQDYNKHKSNWTYYKVFDENDKYVGKFDLKDEGQHLAYLTGLEIPKELRGKRKAINILFNIIEFLKAECKKKGFSIIHFAAANNNQFNVTRLYRKLAPNAISGISDCHTRFAVPLDKSAEPQAKKLINDFELIYRNLILESEIVVPSISGIDIV